MEDGRSVFKILTEKPTKPTENTTTRRLKHGREDSPGMELKNMEMHIRI